MEASSYIPLRYFMIHIFTKWKLSYVDVVSIFCYCIISNSCHDPCFWHASVLVSLISVLVSLVLTWANIPCCRLYILCFSFLFFIEQILIQLVGADDHMYPNYMDAMHWLANTNLLEMVVDKLSPSVSASRCLFFFDVGSALKSDRYFF